MKKLEKLEEPKKRIMIERTENLDLDHVSNKVSVGYFLSWIAQHTPNQNIEDITISLDEEWCDDYYSGSGIIACYIQIGWKEEIDNPHYEAEMKKYQKKLAKQEKKNASY